MFIQFELIEQSSETNYLKMAKRLDPKTLSVGIIGYTGIFYIITQLNKKWTKLNIQLTGETGKALTNAILKSDIFKSTTLIGRRTVNYTEDYYKKGIQKVIDFDKISESEDAFKNLDVLYCCLGTTRGKSGAVRDFIIEILLICLIFIYIIKIKTGGI